MAIIVNENKVAIVTGGARGIGLEIASSLLQMDFKVIIVDILEDELRIALDKLKRINERVWSYCLDISNEIEIENFFQYLHINFNRVDVLINNASISPKTNGKRLDTHLVSLSEWEKVFKVNITGAFLFTKNVLPFMVNQKWGRIINISSVAGRYSSKIAGSHYAATKSALIGFSRTVAGEYGYLGITVNNVAPGRIATPMAEGAIEQTNLNYLKNIPLGKVGKPKDVASIVRFLCSEDAEYITGATIDVNGGVFMS